jgi:hypothetical protein
MKATVGRIVHFYSTTIASIGNGYGLNGQGAGPYPAVVIQTFSSGDYINLKVLGWGKDAWDEGSVSEHVEGGPLDRYWVWPPRE